MRDIDGVKMFQKDNCVRYDHCRYLGRRAILVYTGFKEE
jgi:hypothetical protein